MKLKLFIGLMLLSTMGLLGCQPTKAELNNATWDVMNKELAYDEWQGILIFGKQTGWGHDVTEFIDIDGKKVIKVSSSSESKSKVAETIYDNSSEKITIYDAKFPYLLKSISDKSVNGEDNKDVQLVRHEKPIINADGSKTWMATITIKNNGLAPEVSEIDISNINMFDSLRMKRWLLSHPAVGEYFESPSVDTDEAKITDNRFVITEYKDNLILLDMLEIKDKEKDRTELIYSVEVDDKTTDMINGYVGSFVIIRTMPEVDAKKLEKPVDMLKAALAKLDKPMRMSPKEVASLTMVVEGKGALELKDAPNQKVTRNADGKSVTITIDNTKRDFPVATKEEMEEARKDGVKYPYTNPKVVELTNKALDGATTPKKKLMNIIKFIKGYMDQTMAKNSTSVLQIIDQKSGDCSEHALLFATMARAAGFACREASGYVYCGDHMQGFLGHAWNEVAMERKEDGTYIWYPIDPSWHELRINATHIKIGDDGDSRKLSQFIGTTTFKLIDVKSRRRK